MDRPKEIFVSNKDTPDRVCEYSYSYMNPGFHCDEENTPVGSEESLDDQRFSKEERSSCTGNTRFYLYILCFLTGWGDRMWFFGVGLFLVYMTPGSLQLTAVYGFSIGSSILLFGALIGHWVDTTARRRAVRQSMIAQNLLVCVCAVLIFIVLYHNNTTSAKWLDNHLMKIFEIIIIITAIMSKLNSLALKISLERDWIVEITGKDKDALASTNSVLRAITLTTQVLAPAMTGQIMAWIEINYGAVFIAGWNLISFVVEYYLVMKLYDNVPALGNKSLKQIKVKEDDQYVNKIVTADEIEANSRNDMDIPIDFEDKQYVKQTKTVPKKDKKGSAVESADCKTRKTERYNVCLKRVFSGFIVVFKGWGTYIKHKIAFAGLGLSCLYLNVLTFDYVAIGYAYTQGLTETIVGGLLAAGAVLGIIGSFAFPKMRRSIGLINTGLIGYGIDIICISFCVASVWISGSPFNLALSSGDEIVDKPCSLPLNSGTGNGTAGNLTSSLSIQNINVSSVHNITCRSSTTSSTLSVWFLMVGITVSKFGVCLCDLTINQLLLQSIEEKERGIVNGVQTSLQKFADMLKFLLVICLPNPNQFGLLVLVSYISISLGWILFAKYACNSRRHC